MRTPVCHGVQLLLMVLVGGCDWGPFIPKGTRFACRSSADCIQGFECRQLDDGLECVALGIDGGAGDAGFDAGWNDGGPMDAGFDAGNPNPAKHLRLGALPQTAVAACSSPVTVWALSADGGEGTLRDDTVLGLEAVPGGMRFYSDATCSRTAITAVTLGANSSSTQFRAKAADAGLYTLTVTAPELTSDSQPWAMFDAPSSLVFTSARPNPALGGSCFRATAEARAGAQRVPVVAATVVTLSVMPTAGARFYSDAACTVETTQLPMMAGEAEATFFVKPLTGGTVVISAATAFGTATQLFDTTPIVRRGRCSFRASVGLPDGGSSVELFIDCPVSPPLTNLDASLLLTQTTSALQSGQTGSSEGHCRLTSLSNIRCFRQQGADAAEVHFQVAEVPMGLSVQRLNGAPCQPSLILPRRVDPSHSFVLKALSSSSAAFDDEDATVVTLAGPTSLTLEPDAGPCQQYNIQVAEWEGVTVTRGALDGGMPAGTVTMAVTGLPAASQNSALLIQPLTVEGFQPVCGLMVRGEITSASSFELNRGSGACTATALLDVAYERIDFGRKAQVFQFTAFLNAGTSSRQVTIPPVDVSRSLVFASSQAVGGQGAGQMNHVGSTQYTEGIFRLELTNATTVTVTRGASTANSAVTFFVAELVP